MSKFSKTIVTIGIVIAFIFIFGLITAAMSENGGGTPGIFGLILGFGAYAGIKAVWKKDKQKNDDIDNHQLDKR